MVFPDFFHCVRGSNGDIDFIYTDTDGRCHRLYYRAGESGFYNHLEDFKRDGHCDWVHGVVSVGDECVQQ